MMFERKRAGVEFAVATGFLGYASTLTDIAVDLASIGNYKGAALCAALGAGCASAFGLLQKCASENESYKIADDNSERIKARERVKITADTTASTFHDWASLDSHKALAEQEERLLNRGGPYPDRSWSGGTYGQDP